MTDIRTRNLDRRLILGWQGNAGEGYPSRDMSGAYRYGAADAQSAPDYRPGYTMFKLLLAGSALMLLASLISWQHAHAGSMPDVDAAGHMYVSVPLNSAAPQFHDTTLQVDLMGAGLYVGGMEVATDEPTPRFRLGKRKYQSRWPAQPVPAATHGRSDDASLGEPKTTLFDDLTAAYTAGRQTSK